MNSYYILIYSYNENKLDFILHLCRFGIKHIIATNIILWLRTLIKESVEEIIELEKEALREEGLVSIKFLDQ